jgi:hypothetical protein
LYKRVGAGAVRLVAAAPPLARAYERKRI